jgi:cytochrome c oxidase assembly factor CtaG
VDPSLTSVLTSWTWRADVLAVVTMLAAVYGVGWWRLRARGAPAVAVWRLGAYLGGLLAIVLALFSPIGTLGSVMFVMHMSQHELLAMIAPPLLLLGNPFPVVMWGLPGGLRARFAGLFGPDGMGRRWLRRATWMPVTWPLYVATVWVWHVPAAYGASLTSSLAHDAQHLSFFGAALLFWWPIVDPAPRLGARVHDAWRVAYVIPAAFQSQILGLIFAFYPTLIYPHYAATPRLWGLTALQDQSAAGLVMMQIDGLVYLATVMLLVARLLSREERLTTLQEQIDSR